MTDISPLSASTQSMTPLPIIVIGGSAGALEPLREVVRWLPHDFPGAVLVAIHTSPDYPSRLPDILSVSTLLKVQHAHDHAPLQPGHVYVAPPDHHLLVGQEQLSLSHGPKENRSRPSIDVLFRSAAYTHGPHVIGVLLSGMLDDGTSGLWTIKQLGGHAIVQHPEEATYPSMPLSAVQQINVDAIVPAHDIVARVQALLHAPNFGQERPRMDEIEWRRLTLEVGVAREDGPFAKGLMNYGEFSAFTCPECHGVLVRLQEGGRLRFRCHTGHAYSAESLLSDLNESVEMSLWNSVRALEEEVMLLEHLSKHADEAELPGQASRYRREIRSAMQRLQAVREATLTGTRLGTAAGSSGTPEQAP